MRTWLSVAALLGLSLACCPARAGLYLPAKLYTSQGREAPKLGKGEVFVGGPWPLAPTPERYYRFQLQDSRNVGSKEPGAVEGPLRVRVRNLVKELEGKGSSLTLEETITLGGCYLLQDPTKVDRAVTLLVKAAETERGNFLVLANLASAYLLKRDYDPAGYWQQRVVLNFPRKYPGWTAEQLLFYKRAEQFQLKLIKSRAAESPQKRQAGGLDNLFQGVRFVGPEGKYLPGETDEKMTALLPPDALPLAEQLLLWMPHDERLLWLFAELVNAQGDVKLAYQVLNTLKNQSYRDKDFLAHWDALDAAVRPDTPPGPPAASGTLDWRQLGVGFGSGLLIGVLLMLQVRQWGRRS
jgi:hypothetical protein